MTRCVDDPGAMMVEVEDGVATRERTPAVWRCESVDVATLTVDGAWPVKERLDVAPSGD